jgi:hypothetical protein
MALLVGAPAAVLLPGCGGGSGSVATRLFSAPVTLSSNQTGTLTINLQGQRITGNLIVQQPTSGTAVVPAGNYALDGAFLPPRSFILNGTFPAPLGALSISGELPTSDGPGSFQLKFSDKTVNGTIPVVNPTATPTAAATATVTPTATSTPITR